MQDKCGDRSEAAQVNPSAQSQAQGWWQPQATEAAPEMRPEEGTRERPPGGEVEEEGSRQKDQVKRGGGAGRVPPAGTQCKNQVLRGGGRVSWDEVREWHGHIYTTKRKIDS